MKPPVAPCSRQDANLDGDVVTFEVEDVAEFVADAFVPVRGVSLNLSTHNIDLPDHCRSVEVFLALFAVRLALVLKPLHDGVALTVERFGEIFVSVAHAHGGRRVSEATAPEPRRTRRPAEASFIVMEHRLPRPVKRPGGQSHGQRNRTHSGRGAEVDTRFVISDFYKDQTVSAAQCIEWVRKQVPACKLSDKALANAIAEFAIDYHLPIEFDAAERK